MKYGTIYSSVYVVNFLFVVVLTSDELKVNDILNPRLLPGTLLLESPLLADDDVSVSNSSYDNATTMGDLKDAFDTMQFHRSMMNEYLCHSYVADEILSHLSKKSADQLESRLGEQPSGFRPSPTDKTPTQNPLFPHKLDHTNAKSNLLSDPGSKGYKDWLARSTLFDDIYKHYDQMASADGSQTNANVNGNSNSYANSNANTDYEGGQITGYAVQADKNIDGAKHSGSGGGGGYSHHPPPPSGGSSSGHSGPEYGSTSYSVEYDHHHHHHSKSLALKDLFDLALTALAFLAFGMFILNLIMLCMTPAPQMTVMMMPTTAEPARGRRHDAVDTTVDDMAYRVLLSIDSLLQEEEEEGHCFRYTLCDNNRYSRRLDVRYKVWLPVWSFGMSWLEGKLRNPDSMLENIKASVLGLGNGSCDNLYASCKKVKRRL